MEKRIEKKEIEALLLWYHKHKRPLPWRKDRDPYKIWISEIMLQQTTSFAVKPYYENFLKEFPHLKALACAKEEDVLKLWSGLGYYNRARHLHQSAIKLFSYFSKHNSFPSSYKDWISLNGIGSYTSRAISSQAFGEKVGVLDGNTIRLLSRKLELKIKWWQKKELQKLQTHADECVKYGESGEVNQALMELGSLICLPKNPHCLLCPWKKFCQAYKNHSLFAIPLKKPRKAKEIWLWFPKVAQSLHFKGKFAFIKNESLPFLRKRWIFPGRVQSFSKKPKTYDFYHSITHFDIYVTLEPCVDLRRKKKGKRTKGLMWFSREEIKKHNPSSLIQKTLDFYVNLYGKLF